MSSRTPSVAAVRELMREHGYGMATAKKIARQNLLRQKLLKAKTVKDLKPLVLSLINNL